MSICVENQIVQAKMVLAKNLCPCKGLPSHISSSMNWVSRMTPRETSEPGGPSIQSHFVFLRLCLSLFFLPIHRLRKKTLKGRIPASALKKRRRVRMCVIGDSLSKCSHEWGPEHQQCLRKWGCVHACDPVVTRPWTGSGLQLTSWGPLF